MKNYDTLMIQVINDWVDDYGVDALLEEFFGSTTIGEVFVEMFNAGLIPNDTMEKFINE